MFNIQVCFVFSASSCTQDKENVTKCNITDLQPYTEYTCRITAIFLNQPYEIANLVKKTDATSKCFFKLLHCIMLNVVCK